MITFPDRLPVRISPCPIVEAIFEVRFVSTEPWTTLPGLLSGRIRERYSDQVVLPLSQIPEQMRFQDPGLQHLPLLQFRGQAFLVQLGPRVVSLVTKTGTYPGWAAIRDELDWLLKQIEALGFIREVERLGVRYIDFFGGDLFTKLRLGVHVDDRPLTGVQKDLTTVLRFNQITARLQVSNGAIVKQPAGPASGSILDVDCWIGPQAAGIAAGWLDRFTELHSCSKQLFFGLLRPDFLQQLNPEYE